MVTMTTTMARAPRATTAAAASPSSRASSAPVRATNAPRARASFASFASVSAKVRARASTTTTTRAVDDDDGRSRQDYVKPVQQESALLESETFSAALTAAFVVFLLAGAFFVFGQLAKPVLDVMVQSFPGGSK